MNSFRILGSLLSGAIFIYQVIPAYCSSQAHLPQKAPLSVYNKADDHSIVIKDPVEEKDEMLKIVLREVGKRVSSLNFNRGMDDFTSYIDGIINRAKRPQPQVIPGARKSIDPTETIMEIIFESLYKEDLIRTLNELKMSLIQAKKEVLFLPQIAVFQSLSPEGQTQFRAGSRVDDKLDELPRDKRKLDKIIINPDHLKILLIQRLTQSIGMGKDRASTLNDCKRVLNEFKNRLPQTMPLRSFIDNLYSKLEENASKQPAAPIVLKKVIDFMSPASQVKLKTDLEDDLETIEDLWDAITKTEPSNVMPLWVDQEELEKQRLLDEAENKKKAAEEEKRHQQQEAENKRKAEEAKKEAEAKKSKIEKAKDTAAAKAKEKAEQLGGDATRNILNGVFGGSTSVSSSNAATKGSAVASSSENPLSGLLEGFSF